MDVNPKKSRCEIGTLTQLSYGTGGYKTLSSMNVNLCVTSHNLRFKL